jgi:hypothetical protein
MTSTNQQDSTTGTDAMTTDVAEQETPTQTFERGTWQATLHRSSVLFDKSAGDRKRASTLLWQGGQAAIAEWETKASTDVNAEVLAADLLDIMGTSRKGDVSKIKTVALAVRNHGLVIALYPNLSKAYAEATRLTKTVKQNQADDDAAEKAVEQLASEAPHSATTGESAAKIVLSKGLDEAARLLLDALGASNDAAHRALVRAITSEVAGRVKPKTSTVKAGPKAGATQANTSGTGTSPKATVKAGTKAKPGKSGVQHQQAKATPVKGSTKATPVKHQQAAAPAKKAAPAATTATKPVQAAEKADPAAVMFSDESKPAPAAVTAAKKAAPVAVKRA